MFLAGAGLFALCFRLLYPSGPSRQFITLKVERAGKPVAGLLVRIRVAQGGGREPCDDRSGSFSSVDTTDDSGVAGWSRPIPRKFRMTQRLPPLYDPPETRRVTICAVVDGVTRVMFIEAEPRKYERRMSVTCDQVRNTGFNCYELYPFSWDRVLIPFVWTPLWMLQIGIVLWWRRTNATGLDYLSSLGTGFLVYATLALEKYWVLSQLLAVGTVLATLVALGFSLRDRSKPES